MSWYFVSGWIASGILGAKLASLFFKDGISLFGVIVCATMGPFSLIAPIIWTLMRIRIF